MILLNSNIPNKDMMSNGKTIANSTSPWPISSHLFDNLSICPPKIDKFTKVNNIPVSLDGLGWFAMGTNRIA